MSGYSEFFCVAGAYTDCFCDCFCVSSIETDLSHHAMHKVMLVAKVIAGQEDEEDILLVCRLLRKTTAIQRVNCRMLKRSQIQISSLAVSSPIHTTFLHLCSACIPALQHNSAVGS